MLALLSNITIDSLTQATAKLTGEEIYTSSGYNTWAQELLSASFGGSVPDCAFLILDGMQLMGERLSYPLHVESATTDIAGLGLLPLHTTMEEGKRLRYREHIASPCGLPACQGYEIHHGRSRLTRPVDRAALFGTGAEAAAEAGRPGTDCLGLLLGHCLGTYVHGLLDNDVFRRALLDRMRASKGLDPVGTVTPWDVEAALDRLADRVREHVDLQAIRRMLGLAQAGERA